MLDGCGILTFCRFRRVGVALTSLPILCTQIPVGIPRAYYFGREDSQNILVIDLLGSSLEDLLNMCGRKFTIKTVCMAARQLVCLFVHTRDLPRIF
jgi:casein kinase 1